MKVEDQFKMASILGRRNSAGDYARIGGRTALEGGAGLGLGTVAGLVAAALAMKFPGLRRVPYKDLLAKGKARPSHLDPQAAMTAGSMVLGGLAGGGAGALHGGVSAYQNMKNRNSSLLDRVLRR